MNEREKRREKRRRKAGKRYRTWDLGNGVEQATPDAVLRAMGGLPPDLDWPVLAPNVIPILPRRRAMPDAAGEPFRVTLPPGIPTGFGIDIGPAFLVVGESLLRSWPIGPADLVATALANLRERLRPVRARDLVKQSLDGVPVRVLQSGVGCASALVLVPDELERIFGAGPQCLIAPMRDILISLPPDTDRAFVAWLNDEFSEMDPNGLALDAFVLDADGIRYEALRRSSIAS
ncbi:MAG: hypothetical protein A2V85_12455 [Chloroflexi bacterium RBG_16_72_14]|nr:MAG: hypothetical protein A2V85_12455 [Chloroflexi bacterium RBG_16_72_14]